MEWLLIIIIGGVFVGGGAGFSIYYALRQNKSIMDRARKIDSTIKTRAEGIRIKKKYCTKYGQNEL